MNHDTGVGEGLILYGGPAVVNGDHVEDVQLSFPLASKDLRLRWTAAAGVESRDQAEIIFEHPRLGTYRAEGFVLDTAGFGTIDSKVIGDARLLVEYVTSGWVNLPFMGSTPDQVDDYSTVIEAAGWKLGFSAFPPFVERERHVRRVGIPVYVSHSSRLSRVDGGRFSANNALDVLLAFQLALSFVLGRFVSPIAPNGRDGDELHWVLTPPWFCTDVRRLLS